VIETDPEELEDALNGRTRSSSLFATDTWSLLPNLHLTVSGRYNTTRVELQDTGPSAPALDGNHRFSKFNPAAGLSYQVAPALTLYGGFNQGNRAPTPIELGCADPARPCTLPNALAADPPLNQVVARTFELGARGRLAGNVRWNAGVFQTTNTDDILFVGTTTSAGFFQNFGKTRRRGAELGLSGSLGRFHWNAAYSYVEATFESSACIVSENNSSRGTSTECSPEDPGAPGTFLGDNLIAVRPGHRIPGIPEHAFKLALGFTATDRWRFGADILAFSDQYVRGNENNQHQAGTSTDLNGEARTFLGPGKVGGYLILNLHTRYAIGRGWEVFGRINNVFDKRYFTGGALAENPFDAGGTFQTDSEIWTRETFFAPGTPRAAWVGVRYRIGKAPGA
jgi:iron complex outermembrane receptor protein